MELLEKMVGSAHRGLVGALTALTLAIPSESAAKGPELTSACNLEALYLGAGKNHKDIKRLLKGGCTTLNQRAAVDFEDVLEELWDYKNDGRAKRNGAAKQAAKTVLQRYHKNKGLTSLDKYIKSADDISKETFEHLDFAGIAKEYRLNDRQRKILQKALGTIHGKEIIAYGMTELFPSHNGKRNKALLHYLLQNAGATYLESIPAMYDKFSSYGMWQFTSYAVFDAKGREEGASRMSDHLPIKKQIPGSVNKLEGKDHVRAAYLFAAHNVASLVGNLDGKQMTTFESYLGRAGKNSNDLVQYAATAHHLPGKARNFAERWLRSGAKQNYGSFTKGRLRAYADKTRANYGALLK